jgi:hypothetical protein
MDFEALLTEIWRLEPNGAPPKLLERLHFKEAGGILWLHNGLLTTTEGLPDPLPPEWREFP